MKINCGTFTLWDDGILFGNEKECMVKPWRDAFKMYAAKWKGPSEKAMWFQASDIWKRQNLEIVKDQWLPGVWEEGEMTE